MLRVWGRRTSSNVQAVMWCIAELGLDVERYDVGHNFGGNDTAEFLGMNPNGLVPVLRDGDGPPLWESAVIVRYLANLHGQSPFWPADPAQRAQVDKWAEWSKLNVAMPFAGSVFVPLVRTPEKDRNAVAIARALAALGKQLAIADAQLSRHAYLAGDALTPADIMIGQALYRYFDIPIERPALPHLQRYYDQLRSHPPYVEHVMVDYDDLRVS